MRAIKLFRQRAGLTQQELADLVGVEQPHISRWEYAHHRISDLYLGKIAAALNVEPWEVRYAEELIEMRDDASRAVEEFALSA